MAYRNRPSALLTVLPAQGGRTRKAAQGRQAHAQFTGEATDDAAMVESLGHRVTIFPGSYRNRKVTTPEDLAAVG